VTVRVRIAPSPTGFAHIGTARTALFNWLFARHHGGAFVVRIEDTDRNRLVPGSLESIMEMLKFLGLDPDEGPYAGGDYGPYIQSDRLEIYNRAIENLIAAGGAYRCYCSEERLKSVREEQQRLKQPPGYDRHCRFMSDEDRRLAESSGVTPVVRLAVPLDGQTVVHDEIRGDIAFENRLLQDAVLLKSDGFPTYQLAAPVDDHSMQITHVMRGDEWLASAPLHLILYGYFGWEPPKYAHLPLILGKDRAKLSKRHGDTSFSAFIAKGYLPEALFNFLGLLGWSLDDKTEIISREEFIAHFDLDRVVKSPAIFDFDKLDWMNAEYMRRMDPERFADQLYHWLERDLPADARARLDRRKLRAITELVQERLKRFDQAGPLLQYLFEGAELPYEPGTLLGKAFAGEQDQALFALDELCNELEDLEDWDKDAIWELMQKVAERLGVKRGHLAALVRVAVTGAPVSPPLPESMAILGKKLSIERLRVALDRLRG